MTNQTLPEGVTKEAVPSGGGAASPEPVDCACTRSQTGHRVHGWDCPNHSRHHPSPIAVRPAQWFDPGVLSSRDDDDLDPGGRLADWEAARVYGGRDVD